MKLVVTVIAEIEIDLDNYEEGATREDILEIEKINVADDLDSILDMADLTITTEIVDSEDGEEK